MLHTVAHYLYGGTCALSFICGVILLLMLGVIIMEKKPAEGWVWQVPAVFAGLGVFWAAVAYGLHTL